MIDSLVPGRDDVLVMIHNVPNNQHIRHLERVRNLNIE
jgi:hypothetical protein